MSELNAAGRKRIKKSNFALPKGTGSDPSKDQYPIHDREHAAAALARVAQHGTAGEKIAVKRKVCRLYPDLPACQAK